MPQLRVSTFVLLVAVPSAACQALLAFDSKEVIVVGDGSAQPDGKGDANTDAGAEDAAVGLDGAPGDVVAPDAARDGSVDAMPPPPLPSCAASESFCDDFEGSGAIKDAGGWTHDLVIDGVYGRVARGPNAGAMLEAKSINFTTPTEHRALLNYRYATVPSGSQTTTVTVYGEVRCPQSAVDTYVLGIELKAANDVLELAAYAVCVIDTDNKRHFQLITKSTWEQSLVTTSPVIADGEWSNVTLVVQLSPSWSAASTPGSAYLYVAGDMRATALEPMVDAGAATALRVNVTAGLHYTFGDTVEQVVGVDNFMSQMK